MGPGFFAHHAFAHFTSLGISILKGTLVQRTAHLLALQVNSH